MKSERLLKIVHEAGKCGLLLTIAVGLIGLATQDIKVAAAMPAAFLIGAMMGAGAGVIQTSELR